MPKPVFEHLPQPVHAPEDIIRCQRDTQLPLAYAAELAVRKAGEGQGRFPGHKGPRPGIRAGGLARESKFQFFVGEATTAQYLESTQFSAA